MTTNRLPSFSIRVLALLCAGWIAACGSGGSTSVEPTFELDPTLEPVVETIAFSDATGERRLARVTDDRGRAVDMVEDEVVLTLPNRDELPEILERLHGAVLREVDPNATGLLSDPAPIFILVRVDARHADPAELAELMMEQGDSGAHHRVSSQRALDTLTAIAQESVGHGTELGANFLFTYDSLSERETVESSSGSGAGYSSNAFDLPYMNRGSAQDIGAAEAARMVHDAIGVPVGRNRVDFAVIDGGFLNIPDYPSAEIVPRDRFGRANELNTCSGGGDCPWHGTNVASAAFGIFDDGIGAVGPAGEVVNPILVQSPLPNVWDYLDYIFNVLPNTLLRFPDVVNVSASADIPAGLCLVGVCTIIDVIGRSIDRAGILVFASAGNDGANVDGEDCGPFGAICWEGAYRAPCEAPGVICVGGLQHDANVKATNSATGSKQRSSDDSVDIYAPYSVWVHDTPSRGAGIIPPTTSAKFVSGTSFSSPFAAGVAALIKAANPRLDRDQVWEIMRDTAHTKATGSVHRWVNAQGAVHRALGGAPPFARIEQPTAGRTFGLGSAVPLSCDVQDDDGMGEVTVSWTSNLDGDIGSDSSFSSAPRLRTGTHEITCTATDGRFTVSDQVTISVANTAPSIEITDPTGAEPYYSGNAISVHADASDRNDNLDEIYWSVYTASGFPTPWNATGEDATIPRGTLTPGRYTLVATAYDLEGERAQDSLTLLIAADPANLGPSINSLTITASPVDPLDSSVAYWADPCSVDVTGDGVVNGSDYCQRLRFAANVTDDHDPTSALTFRWTIYEDDTVVETFETTSATMTRDFVVGRHTVELVAFDTDDEPSMVARRSFVVTSLF